VDRTEGKFLTYLYCTVIHIELFSLFLYA
jgi:hypothetical protein